jgi:hypothetical protein
MRFECADPDAVEFTLTHTMTLLEWKSLMKNLSTISYPDADFVGAIREMIGKAEKEFHPDMK